MRKIRMYTGGLYSDFGEVPRRYLNIIPPNEFR